MSKNRLRGITLVRGPIWGIHSLTLIISCAYLVSLVAVPVSARTGTEGNKFVRRPIFANAGLNADLGIEKKMVYFSIKQHLI